MDVHIIYSLFTNLSFLIDMIPFFNRNWTQPGIIISAEYKMKGCLTLLLHQLAHNYYTTDTIYIRFALISRRYPKRPVKLR